IRSQGLLENLPQLWEQFNEIVETDLSFSDALSFAPLVAELDPAQVEYYALRIHHEIEQGYGGVNGQFIFIPQREAMINLMQQVVTPATRSRLRTNLPTVALYNGSGYEWLPYI